MVFIIKTIFLDALKNNNMRKKIILFCFVILIKNTFSQTYKTEIELNELKKKEIIALILEAFNNIEKNEKIIGISLKSSEDVKYLTHENNKLNSNIVEIWKKIIPIQASLTDLKIEKEKKYKNDSILNSDILNVISIMKQKGYLLSDSISQINTYISDADWLKLIQVGKKYEFQGFCQSINWYYVDSQTFKVSQDNNMFDIITENEDNTKLNADKSKHRTITEMERLSDNIFKFTFSDGSICNNIYDPENNRRSGPILFNGKTENSNVEIYFNYSPYSGLFANGMRLIAK
jgi:hypothetical protein